MGKWIKCLINIQTFAGLENVGLTGEWVWWEKENTSVKGYSHLGYICHTWSRDIKLLSWRSGLDNCLLLSRHWLFRCEVVAVGFLLRLKLSNYFEWNTHSLVVLLLFELSWRKLSGLRVSVTGQRQQVLGLRWAVNYVLMSRSKLSVTISETRKTRPWEQQSVWI